MVVYEIPIEFGPLKHSESGTGEDGGGEEGGAEGGAGAEVEAHAQAFNRRTNGFFTYLPFKGFAEAQDVVSPQARSREPARCQQHARISQTRGYRPGK